MAMHCSAATSAATRASASADSPPHVPCSSPTSPCRAEAASVGSPVAGAAETASEPQRVASCSTVVQAVTAWCACNAEVIWAIHVNSGSCRHTRNVVSTIGSTWAFDRINTVGEANGPADRRRVPSLCRAARPPLPRRRRRAMPTQPSGASLIPPIQHRTRVSPNTNTRLGHSTYQQHAARAFCARWRGGQPMQAGCVLQQRRRAVLR